MARFWVQYDAEGNPTQFTRIEAQNCPQQEGQQVTEFEFNQAREKFQELQRQKLENVHKQTPEEEVETFWKGRSAERSAMEWVRQKLDIDEDTAKKELKEIHRKRRGQ